LVLLVECAYARLFRRRIFTTSSADGLAVGLGRAGVADLSGSFVEFLGLLVGRVADVADA